jgi:hypothetical protein
VRLDFMVQRRGIDPAAETCAHALRDLLAAPVSYVERGELWRFESGEVPHGSIEELQQRLRDAACRAGRYVNLNRDECGWMQAARPYPDAAPAGAFAVDIWVRDGDGRDAAALAWFRSQAHHGLEDLRRGILWRLVLPAHDAAAAREAALELAVTRARAHGLLANPHAQTAEIVAVVPGPGNHEESL